MATVIFFTDYSINSVSIPRVDTVNDLGISVNKNLNFSEYISASVSKAYSRSFRIFKGFCSRNPQLLIKAYITYVRPLLEYNTYIWSPCDIGNITKIENVQRRFTKRINVLADLSYKDRLIALNLESLELRRLKFDLVMMYKIVHNLVDLDCDSFVNVTSTITRNANLKIFKPRAVCTIRANFICVRSINAWNFLSETTRAASSIAIFKRLLSKCNLDDFLTVFKFS